MGWAKFRDKLKRGVKAVATGGVSEIIHHNKKKKAKDLRRISSSGGTMQDRAEDAFDRGVSKGQKLFDSTFNKEAFDNMMDMRSNEKKDIAARRRDLSRGLNARENAAQRAAFEAQIRRAGSGARRQVAANIASRGLQGGVANAQRRAVETDIANQRIQAGREQMLANIALKERNLMAYENTINSQESEARNNLLNRLSIGMAGGQQNAQMYAAIQNMLTAQKTAEKNSKGGLLGGNIIPGFL